MVNFELKNAIRRIRLAQNEDISDIVLSLQQARSIPNSQGFFLFLNNDAGTEILSFYFQD